MRKLHRWGRPTECGALEIRRGQRVVILRGERSTCMNCGLVRKQTHGVGNATYSRDGGWTWDAIGGAVPPCDPKLVRR